MDQNIDYDYRFNRAPVPMCLDFMDLHWIRSFHLNHGLQMTPNGFCFLDQLKKFGLWIGFWIHNSYGGLIQNVDSGSDLDYRIISGTFDIESK